MPHIPFMIYHISYALGGKPIPIPHSKSSTIIRIHDLSNV